MHNRVFTQMNCLAQILFVIALADGVTQADARNQKEPPSEVTIEALVSEPERYDGERVIVSGRVGQIAGGRGRRGGEFIILTLEGLASGTGKGIPSVGVITFSLPRLQIGDRALVQGIYHREGTEAGRFMTNFIRVEAILRE